MRWTALGIAALLLLVFAIRVLDTAAQKSLTVDEPHYVGTGLYLWESGDYHYMHTLRFHPPLAYHLASVPLLAVDLGSREITRDIGARLMEGGKPGPDRVRWLSRLPFALLSCWGALLVLLWACEAAGPQAGLLAAALYTGSPVMLANSALAHSDITVTVFFVQTLYTFWRWSRRPTLTRLLLCGLSLGLALIAKLTALLLLPVLGVLLLALAYRLPVLASGTGAISEPTGGTRADRGRPLDAWLRPGLVATGQLGILISIAVMVVWLGYGGSFALYEVESGALEGLHLPGLLHGLLYDIAANTRGRAIYFFGQIREDGGFRFLLPAAWALKTPIPVLLLLVLALCTRPAPGPESRRGIALFAGVPILVFLALTVSWVRVPLGVRYVLPVFPLIHLFVATRLAPLAGWRRSFTALCLLWLGLAGAWIHPHYLAYFNELVGGPARGHEVLVDSNLDWGQDLRTLAKTLEELGAPTISLAYFGPEPPARFGIRSKPLDGCHPTTGYVAISATVRHGIYWPRNPFVPPPRGCYDWLDPYEPIAQPGYSILLYHIAEEP